MYPKVRIDALTDGIFAVAMTLLVLDVRLPDDVHPTTSAELLRAFLALAPRLLPYAVSFLVLGLRWLSNLRADGPHETVDDKWVQWWLVYMLLITCVPFTTLVVGRYATLPPAIWLFAGNTILVALIGIRMAVIQPQPHRARAVRERRIGFLLLIGSSVLAILLSFVVPQHALWVYALTALSPVLTGGHGRTAKKAAA